MLPDKVKKIKKEIPVPLAPPERTEPGDPEDPPLAVEEPDLVPEEDPYENPPSFEKPEPGEGP